MVVVGVITALLVVYVVVEIDVVVGLVSVISVSGSSSYWR